MSRWISVYARLPPLNTEVLVAFDNISIAATAQLTKVGGIRQWLWPKENDPREGEPPLSVTHWMPLPEPPLGAAAPLSNVSEPDSKEPPAPSIEGGAKP